MRQEQKQCSGRWSSRSGQDDLPDFDKIFNAVNFSALELLDIDSIVEEVKRAGNKFTDKLIQHPKIVKDLIDICLRPLYYSKTHQVQINLDIVYKCIQILTNQSEQFSDFIVGTRSKCQNSQDQVLTDQLQEQRDLTIFLHLFKMFQTKPVDQTSSSYLNKILTSVVYQKQSDLIDIFNKRKQLLEIIFNHYYSKSVNDLFWKIIQMEDNSNFYQKDKILYLSKIPYLLEKENQVQYLSLCLQNVATLYEQILSKNDDRFDKSKFNVLSKQIVNQPYLYHFLTNRIQKYLEYPQILCNCLQIIDILLRFNTCLKQSQFSKNSQSNLDSSFLQIKINNQIIKFVFNYIMQLYNQVIDNLKYKSSKIYYFRIIYALMSIDSSLIDTFFTQEFVRGTIKTMLISPNNNILHNTLKQILIEGIKKSEDGYKKILNQNSNFLATAKIVLSEKNSQYSYQNQIYYILTAIYNKIILKFGQLEKSKIQYSTKTKLLQLLVITQKKQKFYNTEICGNPRRQSQSWDCSSNQIAVNLIQKLSLSMQQQNQNQKQTQNQHWLDSELPLDSDDQQDDKMESKQLKINSQQIFSKRFPNFLTFSVQDLMNQIL